MMEFCITKSARNGIYEIHNLTAGCLLAPENLERIDLGLHVDFKGAYRCAHRQFANLQLVGCPFCCEEQARGAIGF